MSFNTLKDLFTYSTNAYASNKCFSTVNNIFYTYSQVKSKVEEVSSILIKNKVKFGDKIGILCQNMPNWGVSFFSCVAYGRVAVPMLPDFSQMEIDNILKHSESKGIFVSKKLYHKLSEQAKNDLDFIIEIDDFTVLKGEKTLENQVIEGLPSYNPDPMDLALIIYTSGTTGNSKGVMLTHKNLCSHLETAKQMRPSFEWDVWLSILPLSHTLECSLSLILPFASGSSVYYLDKAPTPTILLNALQKVRPTTLLVVPLIIEKIFKSSILAKINSNKFTAAIYTTTLGRKALHYLSGIKMKKMFGGRMRFFGIGGAKVDGNVERFLLEAKFPYAIGYGLTECSPLLAGAPPHLVKWQTTGPAVPFVQLKINHPDPVTGEGEIVAKGDNIMPGYYKNPEATAEAFTSDGWFRTKDLGYIDSNGWLSIRGRLNSMIVGASGENIYPEEIETVINSHELVQESLVTKSDSGLEAHIVLNPDKVATLSSLTEEASKKYYETKKKLIDSYQSAKEELKQEIEFRFKEWESKIERGPDGEYNWKDTYEAAKREMKLSYDDKRRELFKSYEEKRDVAALLYEQSKAELKKSMDEKSKQLSLQIHSYVNSKVNKFSKVSVVIIRNEAFEKTATQKIKRYLYKKAN